MRASGPVAITTLIANPHLTSPPSTSTFTSTPPLAMLRTQLPTSSLPAFAHLNNIHLNGLEVTATGGYAGTGLEHNSTNYDPSKPLLTVERELVLCAATVEGHAKSDVHLAEVLEAVGDFALTPRGAIMVFLAVQLGTAAGLGGGQRGVWSEYVKFLPSHVSIPTTWTDAERNLLTGTSLHIAVVAKLHTLQQEFEHLQSRTSHIQWCQRSWWDTSTLTISDWNLLDSWFRSRVLQFPFLGIGMAPLLDFANHSSDANACYRVDDNGDVVLVPIANLQDGDEVTINYGGDKSAAEMAFSYGFIDASMSSALGMVLDLKCPADDPLNVAKEAVFKSAPTLRLTGATWMGDFIWLVCVNSEDGLSFQVLQSTDGTRKLVVLWEDEEVEISGLEARLERSVLWEVYQLRALSLVLERVEVQLFALMGSEDAVDSAVGVGRREMKVARMLRGLERGLLEEAVVEFEKEKEKLLETEVVREYLSRAGADLEQDGERRCESDDDEDVDLR